MVAVAVYEHGRFVPERALMCPQRRIMSVQMVKSRQEVGGDVEAGRRTRFPSQADSREKSPRSVELSHLQSIHAEKRGITLKGTNHETFWEWCT